MVRCCPRTAVVESLHVEYKIKNKFTPARVIDIGLPDGSENLKLLNIKQSGTSNDVDIEYITLAHYWE